MKVAERCSWFPNFAFGGEFICPHLSALSVGISCLYLSGQMSTERQYLAAKFRIFPVAVKVRPRRLYPSIQVSMEGGGMFIIPLP
jgi:hypothetical protein